LSPNMDLSNEMKKEKKEKINLEGITSWNIIVTMFLLLFVNRWRRTINIRRCYFNEGSRHVKRSYDSLIQSFNKWNNLVLACQIMHCKSSMKMQMKFQMEI
jgi:hypothetical protein